MPSRASTPEIADDLADDVSIQVQAVDKSKLNPVVMPSGAVRRVYVTDGSRGATPPVSLNFLVTFSFIHSNDIFDNQVTIANPVTPFFDPYNHEFPNSDCLIDR
jgi:hypothetical protein